mmetsp:Transcript_13832/g.26027  ORF Transcript_13832/g.26027 Transcript_13832/m.26027 type:complete len:249 (-) Transcript_13832:474-1220(-)
MNWTLPVRSTWSCSTVGSLEGEALGDVVGAAEGDAVGDAVGATEGDAEGAAEGDAVGDAVGDAEGDAEGEDECNVEGEAEGAAEGDAEGDDEGDAEGEAVGALVGDVVGLDDGEAVGGEVVGGPSVVTLNLNNSSPISPDTCQPCNVNLTGAFGAVWNSHDARLGSSNQGFAVLSSSCRTSECGQKSFKRPAFIWKMLLQAFCCAFMVAVTVWPCAKQVDSRGTVTVALDPPHHSPAVGPISSWSTTK